MSDGRIEYNTTIRGEEYTISFLETEPSDFFIIKDGEAMSPEWHEEFALTQEEALDIVDSNKLSLLIVQSQP